MTHDSNSNHTSAFPLSPGTGSASPLQCPPTPDPRIYFAAERTLLAWLRTGLAVIGLGFLVARFGLFLALLRRPVAEVQIPLTSSIIGIGFVLLGAAMIAIAAWQHTRFCGELLPAQRPSRYWMSFGVGVSLLIATLGAALAAYLLWGVRSHGVQPDSEIQSSAD